MAYTLEQYSTLVESLAQAVTTVQYSDRTVTYRSLKDMKQIKADMERELFGTAKDASVNRVKMFYDKGL